MLSGLRQNSCTQLCEQSTSETEGSAQLWLWFFLQRSNVTGTKTPSVDFLCDIVYKCESSMCFQMCKAEVKEDLILFLFRRQKWKFIHRFMNYPTLSSSTIPLQRKQVVWKMMYRIMPRSTWRIRIKQASVTSKLRLPSWTSSSGSVMRWGFVW